MQKRRENSTTQNPRQQQTAYQRHLKIRVAHVSTQTDPVQVFPIPSVDPRKVVFKEEAAIVQKKIVDLNKKVLEHKAKLMAHTEKLKKAQMNKLFGDPSYPSPLKKKKMIRTSGPPGASCKLTLSNQTSTSTSVTTDYQSNIQDTEKELERPPTPGSNHSTQDEDLLLYDPENPQL